MAPHILFIDVHKLVMKFKTDCLQTQNDFQFSSADPFPEASFHSDTSVLIWIHTCNSVLCIWIFKQHVSIHASWCWIMNFTHSTKWESNMNAQSANGNPNSPACCGCDAFSYQPCKMGGYTASFCVATVYSCFCTYLYGTSRESVKLIELQIRTYWVERPVG